MIPFCPWLAQSVFYLLSQYCPNICGNTTWRSNLSFNFATSFSNPNISRGHLVDCDVFQQQLSISILLTNKFVDLTILHQIPFNLRLSRQSSLPSQNILSSTPHTNHSHNNLKYAQQVGAGWREATPKPNPQACVRNVDLYFIALSAMNIKVLFSNLIIWI